jgi:hypothetical protein
VFERSALALHLFIASLGAAMSSDVSDLELLLIIMKLTSVGAIDTPFEVFRHGLDASWFVPVARL